MGQLQSPIWSNLVQFGPIWLGQEGKGALLGASGRLENQGGWPSAAVSTCRWHHFNLCWGGQVVHHSLWTQFRFCLSKPKRSGCFWARFKLGCQELLLRTYFQGVPELTLVHVSVFWTEPAPARTSLMPGPFRLPSAQRHIKATMGRFPVPVGGRAISGTFPQVQHCGELPDRRGTKSMDQTHCTWWGAGVPSGWNLFPLSFPSSG